MASEGLVQIGSLSRRGFLKALGTGAAVGAVGCTDKVTEKIIPFVNPIKEQIPGVAVWYSSTCTECSAGCGIQVRTRDGRAVKIEGNPHSPINRGGLCGLGQSAVQNLYDPDRIRQPLFKDDKGNFVPIDWDQALTLLAEQLKDTKSKKAFITGDYTGSLDQLVDQWSKEFSVNRVSYDALAKNSEAKAAELVFGKYGVPTYSFEKAKVILNFGADFLETWVSPVEYARGWSDARKSDKPNLVVHVEPRLSLTGANADLWLSAKPGTEVRLALAVLKLLLAKGRGAKLSDELRDKIKQLTEHVELVQVADETGIPVEKILLVAQYLNDVDSSLVIAGGTVASSNQGLSLMVVANFINLVLGNLGKTISLAKIRKTNSSLPKLVDLIAKMKKKEVNCLFVHGVNPSYNLPPSFEFDYALKSVEMVISFSSHMDETTAKANLILPSNTNLESWGDATPFAGVYALSQPTMQPVFQTKMFGDSLLLSADMAGKSASFAGHKAFDTYLKANWEKQFGAKGNFARFWLEAVERGGYFEQTQDKSDDINVEAKAFKLDFDANKFKAAGGENAGLVFFPFPSVRSFDGRAANRAWLSEVPDPISQIAWDAWAEISPKSAAKFGLAKGDLVTLRNGLGELSLPLVISPYVHDDIVAVPMGHGHTGFGRFAMAVKGNAMLPLPNDLSELSGSLATFSTKVSVIRARGAADAVNVQGSDDQMGRGIGQTSYLPVASLFAAEHGHDSKNGHHDQHDKHAQHGHHAKQMYEQREHPLYRWGLGVDLAACTGCSACVVACYAENNIAVVGKEVMSQGREMAWLRIERFYDRKDGAKGMPDKSEELTVSFVPAMCQHCESAPCEPVCPVFATYHNDEGLNAMVYNRCVGTRYCANNCPYKQRRFNWFQVEFPEPLNWQLNPDVTPRNMGIMEKCTFCIQRISEGKDRAKDLGRQVLDGEIQPACVQSCPTQALVFGNLNDHSSKIFEIANHERAYKILDHHINTRPAVTYLEDIKYKI